MEIRFWGVRGSIAVSGSHVDRVGGNTSCIEVTSGGERLILDAGTGIRGAGEQMLQEGMPTPTTLLFSHLHWDHVQGFPFFKPAYESSRRLTLYGPGPSGDVELQRVLARQMQQPSFPVPLTAMRSQMRFATAEHCRPLHLGPFCVTPFELPHPQGCLGYRVEADGACFVYATDVEISLSRLTPTVGRMLEGADVLCLDAQYTPDEYLGKTGAPKVGWGHSTMVDAAKVATAVNAKKLLLFHHDPVHSDDIVESMAEEARLYFTASEPAREGKRILLGRVVQA